MPDACGGFSPGLPSAPSRPLRIPGEGATSAGPFTPTTRSRGGPPWPPSCALGPGAGTGACPYVAANGRGAPPCAPNTPMAAYPLLYSGTSPPMPQAYTQYAALCPAEERSTYQRPWLGRQTISSCLPSVSTSPTRGLSLSWPQKTVL